MSSDCKNCVYLDKNKRIDHKDGQQKKYGCTAELLNGWVCAWVNDEKELRLCGCSEGVRRKN